MTVCRHCATTWTGAKIAHCATCHHTFTVPNHFDKHRVAGACTDPATHGLVLNPRGQWAGPPRDDGAVSV